jgi:transketolase
MTTAERETELDELCINTIRTLAIDAVEKANSGHPGTPMALAPVAYTLYTRLMRHNPQDAKWPNRDRFVLSNGHASMLLYASLYLSGYPGITLAHRVPGTPSTATSPGSRRRPARSGRAFQWPSAWQSASGCSPRATTGQDTT